MTSHELAANRHRQLAELWVSRDPWRAAVAARRATQAMPRDDRAWAVYAMSQTLLGHYRCAVRAYERAVALAPDNPSYIHNLGHLLDRRLGRHAEAVEWLRKAYAQSNRSHDIAMSLVHALGRIGAIAEAKCILTDAMADEVLEEHAALWRWLSDGAGTDAGTEIAVSGGCVVAQRQTGRKEELIAAILERELRNLPFDEQERAHALALAHASLSMSGGDDLGLLAATAAYSVAYLEDIPLSPREVAASFRIPTARLRAKFDELRPILLINRPTSSSSACP